MPISLIPTLLGVWPVCKDGCPFRKASKSCRLRCSLGHAASVLMEASTNSEKRPTNFALKRLKKKNQKTEPCLILASIPNSLLSTSETHQISSNFQSNHSHAHPISNSALRAFRAQGIPRLYDLPSIYGFFVDQRWKYP